MSCVEPVIVWPDCPVRVGENDFVQDSLPWLLGSVLQEAALCVALEGPCVGSHFDKGSDRDGLDVLTPKGPGLVWAEPDIDPVCCGAIATGVVWPAAGPVNDCVHFTELEFRVKVSWCGDDPVYAKLVDAARFDRLLLEVACCKLAALDGLPKFTFRKVNYVHTDGGVCDSLTIAVKAQQ